MLRSFFFFDLLIVTRCNFREFKVSVFEIYSDRGKGEKISDLSPDGGDLSMQQATIKGLQEVDDFSFLICH
jgi:hypothetical protein